MRICGSYPRARIRRRPREIARGFEDLARFLSSSATFNSNARQLRSCCSADMVFLWSSTRRLTRPFLYEASSFPCSYFRSVLNWPQTVEFSCDGCRENGFLGDMRCEVSSGGALQRMTDDARARSRAPAMP